MRRLSANPLQATLKGTSNAFVTKINPGGSALLYSTYLGGAGRDEAHGIAIDGSGNACVAGFTASTDFPTANPIQANSAGRDDAFVLLSTGP